MRLRARTDANQKAIVKDLRAVGALVLPLHQLGQGCPDLLVAYCGAIHLFEVKDGSKPPCRHALTPDEQSWHEPWRGYVRVIKSSSEALEAIGIPKADTL